jgi:hypothetical protein
VLVLPAHVRYTYYFVVFFVLFFVKAPVENCIQCVLI